MACEGVSLILRFAFEGRVAGLCDKVHQTCIPISRPVSFKDPCNMIKIHPT